MSVRLDPSSWAYAFPMVRAGGVFIFIMGAGVVLGALLPGRRRSLLIIGAGVATVAIVLLAAPLSAPFGTPTRLQLWFLFGSISAEAILIRKRLATTPCGFSYAAPVASMAATHPGRTRSSTSAHIFTCSGFAYRNHRSSSARYLVGTRSKLFRYHFVTSGDT